MLTRIDKDRLKDWLADDQHELELGCGRDIEVWDSISVAGIFTILIGMLAAPLVPPITFGAFVASAFLLWHGCMQRIDDRACDRTEREIKRMLRTLRQIIG